MAKESCKKGTAKVPKVVAPVPQVAYSIMKQKIKPTPKTLSGKLSQAGGSSIAGSEGATSVVAPIPRKRDTVDLPFDGLGSSKVARTSFTLVVPCCEASQSSGRSIAPPTAPPLPYDPVMMWLDPLTDSLRQSHKENILQMEFSFNKSLHRIADLRNMIAEDRAQKYTVRPKA